MIEIISFIYQIKPDLKIFYNSYFEPRFQIYSPEINDYQAPYPLLVPEDQDVLKNKYIENLTNGVIKSNAYSRNLTKQQIYDLVHTYYPWRELKISPTNYTITKLINVSSRIDHPRLTLEAIDRQGNVMVIKTYTDQNSSHRRFYPFFNYYNYRVLLGDQMISTKAMVMDYLDPLPDQIDYKLLAYNIIDQLMVIHAHGYCVNNFNLSNIRCCRDSYVLIDLDLNRQQGSYWFQDPPAFESLNILSKFDIKAIDLLASNGITESGYRNDMLRLGFLILENLPEETTNYLNYFGRMPVNQLLKQSDYQAAKQFFS